MSPNIYAAVTLAVTGTAALFLLSNTYAPATNFLGLPSEDQEITHAFIQFMAKHGRSYASKEHTNQKYSAFKDTYLKVQAHNREEKGFKMAVN